MSYHLARWLPCVAFAVSMIAINWPEYEWIVGH